MDLESIRELNKKDFPPLLGEIPDAPSKLYIRGKKPDYNSKFISVVGSRKFSSYGKGVTEDLIGALRGLEVTIVSGLALGIDSIAHEAALKNNLKTIAIPGSGLNDDVIYPRSHLGLAKRIIQNGGSLISEYEPDFKATVWSFPKRNRIMAGMSHAILVVECSLKSGTLITSRLATEYNRDVLTVPGSIYNQNSEGPNMLLKLGATPITSGKDLRGALGFIEENTNEKTYSDCSTDELAILDLLGEPHSRDELIRLSNKDVSEINALLSMLEIKGYISETLGEFRKI
jgi:DNA processing protein